MFKGFKEFILKGNVVDMAVGIVIGVAFGNVVTALVKDLITPFMGTLGGVHDFSGIYFTVGSGKYMIGDFLNTAISFLTVSAVIYFGIVLPMNKLTEKMKSGKTENPTEKACPECLSLIPIKARRCKYCSAPQKK